MAISVLITQCLQRDFIEPTPIHEPLPNRLHVGRSEAIRLMGADPRTGPVAQLMGWARAQRPDTLEVIHVRDWHDPTDPRQAAHFERFGPHCERGTRGAQLVLDLDAGVVQAEGRGLDSAGADPGAGRRPGGIGTPRNEAGWRLRPRERVVDAGDLNDFEETPLAEHLAALRARAGGDLRVGVVGVWTDAKVSFLLYDLKTRGRIDQLATCSALTASPSRLQHFNALEQLERLLGVQVFDSVGEFCDWLCPGGAPVVHLPREGFGARIDSDVELASEDREILSYLYRDSARVVLTPLTGGFSGSSVFRATSVDALGHEQAPSVAKLGPRRTVAAERVAFERVEAILGNYAPSVRGFVDLHDRAGIKYAYAGMGSGRLRTFKSLYAGDAPQAQIDAVLSTTFKDILGSFYAAAQYERLPLLEHYRFSSAFAPSVRRQVESLLGDRGMDDPITFEDGTRVRNVCAFYEQFLVDQPTDTGEHHYVSYVHGDLNGANILIDGRDNVWLIDFFHTARGHVLKDVAKLENDLLYIFTPLENEAALVEALQITRALRSVLDLRQELPERLEALKSPGLIRAWETLRTLRRIVAGLCREDRDPLQLKIALLRYAVHTLSFDESSSLQKRWALASACGLAEDIAVKIRTNRAMRVDWVEREILPTRGRLGMTLCPGRRDRGRSLEDDLDALEALGADNLICLITEEELEWAGISGIRVASSRRNLRFHHLPIIDQSVPTLEDAQRMVRWIRDSLEAGENVVVHCMGGLGRTGTIAASVLIAGGMGAEDAIAVIRRTRGPRAIETAEQEAFVRSFSVPSAEELAHSPEPPVRRKGRRSR